jgi:mannosyltransferase OCH1-like enzyme
MLRSRCKQQDKGIGDVTQIPGDVIQISNPDCPHMVHMIYIPWNKKTQRLEENENHFDHSSYKNFKTTYPAFLVRLWKRSDIKSFVSENYPDYQDTIWNVSRPAMIVDIMRILIIYHYGGIYWQYESISKTSLVNFLPSKEKQLKLFTETVLTHAQAEDTRKYVIREGLPEENIRICNQVFSAVPKHPYLWKLFLQAISNVQKFHVKEDYDILFITGNALFSTFYDKIGKYDSTIECVSLKNTKEMISISSHGSWRTDSLSKKTRMTKIHAR